LLFSATSSEAHVGSWSSDAVNLCGVTDLQIISPVGLVCGFSVGLNVHGGSISSGDAVMVEDDEGAG
jgi:hypothetical protein